MEIIPYLKDLVSPRTKNVAIDKVICATEYSCDDKKCDFEKVKKDIINSMEITEYAMRRKQIPLHIVETIENNSTEFLPHKYDGFCLNHRDTTLVYMKRKESTGEGRTGIIEI